MKNEQELNDFVNRQVYLCQSHLVEHLLEKEIFSYDDVINGYYTEKEARANGYTDLEIETLDYEQPKEIFEWWLCSDWLLEKLEEQGEPILKTDFGSWWGRGTTGQSIILDSVIEKIYEGVKK